MCSWICSHCTQHCNMKFFPIISLNFRYVTTNLLLQPSGLDSIYLTASVCEPVKVFAWPLLSVHNTAECWVITGRARVCRHRFSCKQKHTANYIRSKLQTKSNICTSRLIFKYYTRVSTLHRNLSVQIFGWKSSLHIGWTFLQCKFIYF